MKCSKCGAELETNAKFCIVCGQTAPTLQKIKIGRGADCDVIINHERISRLHAVIVPEGMQYRITDQGSMNGVYVNGQRVSTALINPGDQVSLGKAVSLDWNRLLAAFSAGPSGATGPLGTGPSPVFYIDDEKKPQKSSSTLPLVIAIVAVVLVGMGLGAYFLFFRGGKDVSDKHDVTYSYATKPGETSEMSERRSKLETMEKILEEIKTRPGLENSSLMAYCLVDVNIGEPQNVFNQKAEVEAITRTASAIVSKKEFDRRLEQLRSNPNHLQQIREAETRMVQAKFELGAAEAMLTAPKNIGDTVDQVFDALGELVGLTPDSTKTKDEKPKVDTSMEGPRQNYERAIHNIEEIYDSLNSIKLDLAKGDRTKRNGRVLK